jgi:hypothetical protein
MVLPADVKERFSKLVQHQLRSLPRFIMYFQGPYGVGKQTTVESLCSELGLGLLVVNGERLLAEVEPRFHESIKLASREALLQNAALYWQGLHALLEEGKQPLLQALIQELETRQGLTFLSGVSVWEPADSLRDVRFVRVESPHPDPARREQLWARSLNGSAGNIDSSDLKLLNSKFRFSGGQIRDTAATARNLARWRDPENPDLTGDDLHAASRLQSNRKLATLAQKITPRYGWSDIILPPDRLQQLREICNYVKYNALVYHQWGSIISWPWARVSMPCSPVLRAPERPWLPTS